MNKQHTTPNPNANLNMSAWLMNMNMNYSTPNSSVGNPLSIPNSATGSGPNPANVGNTSSTAKPHNSGANPLTAMPNMLDLSSLRSSLPSSINIQNVQNNISLPGIPNLGNLPGMPNLPGIPPLSSPLPLPNLSIPNLSSSENPSAPAMPSLMPIILTPDDAIKALANSLPMHGGADSGLGPLGTLPNLGARSMSQSDVTNSAANANGNDVLVRTLRAQLAREKAKMQLIQTAYWSLRSDFDNVCDVMKAQSLSMANGSGDAKDSSTAKMGKKKSKLTSISEGESTVFKEELAAKLRDREQEFAAALAGKQAEVEALTKAQIELARELEAARTRLLVSQGELKGKVKESNKRNNGLERDVKNLKHKIKKLEKENKKLSTVQAADEQKAQIKTAVLGELYLNSNRIKEFMAEVKRAGELYEALKKRQMEMVDRDKDKDKDKKGDEGDAAVLYRDIVRGEDSYRALYESLDILKTESQGKELELMTRNKEYIALLEKEKFVQSSHLEEYVKKNQTLQLDLTDREMKLRQTQNELNHAKQRVSRLQNENDTLMDHLQNGHARGPAPQMGMNSMMQGPPPHSHSHFMANMNAQYPAHNQFNPAMQVPQVPQVPQVQPPNMGFGGFNPNANPYAQ